MKDVQFPHGVMALSYLITLDDKERHKVYGYAEFLTQDIVHTRNILREIANDRSKTVSIRPDVLVWPKKES